MKKLLLALSMSALSATALASGGGAAKPFEYNGDLGNQASLQRGARNYMAYCAGCHGLEYMRYNRIGQDLNLTEEQVKTSLIFGDAKPGDVIKSTMSIDKAAQEKSAAWFGRTPPDLSLETRVRGSDWVYNYLMTFYLDPKAKTGVNNLMLPGLSMPHVLGELQGWQTAQFKEVKDAHGKAETHFEGFTQVQAGSMSPKEYAQFATDLTNFLTYVGEPAKLVRYGLGVKVLAFLLLLTGLFFLLKKEYWKDVH